VDAGVFPVDHFPIHPDLRDRCNHSESSPVNRLT
jgi:hypothetical protein